jgi:hypothetical protein
MVRESTSITTEQDLLELGTMIGYMVKAHQSIPMEISKLSL